ncbi:MAG: hypothetical protein KIT72_00020 [Polyangiaceae bacterium]|nr:hypothetical protein [Polyangiaceae bacterium]MCW5788780.1 hypothetical protein [Polyangiaceae bacterium]
MSQKPAIRVRAADGKPREWKALHTALGGQTFIRVYAQTGNVEFILTADSAKQLEGLREKLAAAGVEEMVGGATIAATAPSRLTNTQPTRRGGFQPRGGPPPRGGAPQGRQAAPANNAQPLPGKPYGFVALPNELKTASPIWHDGTGSAGRLSGEIRLELETLTPLLVGWERGQVGDGESDWPVPTNLPDVGQLKEKKSVLCPLRAPWGKRPVVIPGDSLKGLLRHELGALLGAPMARTSADTFMLKKKKNGNYEREGLPSLDNPQDPSDSPISNLVGYVRDDDWMMGHVAVNAALEVVAEEDEEARFEKPTFLKVLGAPDHKIGQHYLKRPLPDANQEPLRGTVAGRKFYLERSAEIAQRPWEDTSDKNKKDDQSTLVLEASKPGRKFRFTVRFRDVDPIQLTAVLIALSPEQFKGVLEGTHKDGYCSKLGYARPLGWGSIRIEAKALLLLDEAGYAPVLEPVVDLSAWVTKHHQKTGTQDEWLAIHRFKHPDAADYPKPRRRTGGVR